MDSLRGQVVIVGAADTDVGKVPRSGPALWNAHRIHYDYPYATEAEGYPGLVIAGPLLGDWLTQSVIEWLGDDGNLTSIEYSNRKASYIGEVLRSGGKVISSERNTGTVELEMYIKNEADEVITPGVATVRFPVT